MSWPLHPQHQPPCKWNQNISSSSQTCRSCLISWVWNPLIPELHWRSCIWSRGWIHGSQPATQCHTPLHPQHYYLANGIRISYSSHLCISCWFLGFEIDWFQSYNGDVTLEKLHSMKLHLEKGLNPWKPSSQMVSWPLSLHSSASISWISSSQTFRSCWFFGFGIDWFQRCIGEVVSEKLHWKSCIWRKGRIHGNQPTTQCHGHNILSINLLANGIRISSSSQTCRSCLMSWVWNWLISVASEKLHS